VDRSSAGVDLRVVTALFLLCLVLSAAYYLHIYTAGYATKRAIALGRSPFLRLEHAVLLMATLYAILLGGSFLRGRIPWILMFVAAGWNAVGLALAGERDFFLRILWVTFFIFHACYRRIPVPILAGLLVSGLLLIAVGGELKSALISRESIDLSNVFRNPYSSFIPDEFLTASENLQTILNETHRWSYCRGESLLWDLARAFTPSSVYQHTPELQIRFNRIFWPEIVAEGGGRGFTLVGEGYMNLGAFGVMVWFLLMGLFVRGLYAVSRRGLPGLAVYVMSMPIAVYVIRSDFSALLTQFTRHVFFPVLAVILIQKLLDRVAPRRPGRPSTRRDDAAASVVTVTIERRFDRTPDGRVWVPDVETYSFWQRYLEVFDQVRVVARVRDVPEPPPASFRSDGPSVTFAALPYYVGPWQYLSKAGEVVRSARAAIEPRDAVILRLDSQIAACVQPMLERTGHPYGVEVVADPQDCFAPGVIEHPLRPFFRWKFARDLRRQCRGAAAAAYVTERALQRRYPPGPGAFSTHYSSVELPDEAFAMQPRSGVAAGRPWELVTVGAMTDRLKGQDAAIEAVDRCRRDGVEVNLTVIGEGRYRERLEAQAAAMGLGGRVRFAGRLATPELREALDHADLFVLPSRAEGLPRALLEAMARGLPAIASSIGGIPELLASEDLVRPGDAEDLGARLREVLSSPSRMAAMSARNLKKAGEYRLEVLARRRREFYRLVQEATREWAGRRSAGAVVEAAHGR
jgi:oligosaccharide repeat unit polymerase